MGGEEKELFAVNHAKTQFIPLNILKYHLNYLPFEISRFND